MVIYPLGLPDVVAIHNTVIERFGGLAGTRDSGLLESALAQPFQAFGGVELYPSLPQKAAVYAWGIAKNHPFNDGNKRTAIACMASFLRGNGMRFKPRHDELYDAICGVAEGFWDLPTFSAWVAENAEEIVR